MQQFDKPIEVKFMLSSDLLTIKKSLFTKSFSVWWFLLEKKPSEY